MCVYIFFFKQKTAYEMRISDWSSDVCSSDLLCDTAEPACVYCRMVFGNARSNIAASPWVCSLSPYIGRKGIPGKRQCPEPARLCRGAAAAGAPSSASAVARVECRPADPRPGPGAASGQVALGGGGISREPERGEWRE